ncbi:MAG: ABC transporter permease subunit [Anaerolineales bacterium]|nr:ABC transporter permease subunit [Anaerolineales bacterium]
MRDWLKRVALALRTPSFLLGGGIVLALIMLAAIGPEIAPHSPYVSGRLQLVEGTLQKAPIEPCRTFPLGTDANGSDMLSLLLYGARTTLMMVIFAATIRLFLGLILGALAGWWAGRLFDRIFLRIVELFAALPNLILAVVVLFAVGLQHGQAAFIAALALSGWGEVAQILRSHVLGIRQQEYISSARAVGLTPIGILSRHVLPNLTGTVLTLASLEIGRTLLLLSELGFIQIFIGGGILAPGDVGSGAVLTADIPEWGAILGSTWRSFRTYPWLPGTPAAAFFIAIAGFNLFGYGLKQFLDRGRFYPSGLSVFRFLAALFLVLAGLQFVLSRSGPEMWYREDAAGFNAQQARRVVLYLTQAAFHGRSEGSAEAALSAAYISRAFRDAGLTTLRDGRYYQSFPVSRGSIIYDAQLKIPGEDPVRFSRADGFLYDFSTMFESQAAWETDNLLFVNNPARTAHALFPQGQYFLFDESNPYLRIEILPDDELPWYGSPNSTSASFDVIRGQPAFKIRESTAAAVLTQSDLEFDILLEQAAEADERVVVPLEIPARVESGVLYETVLGINVVGYLPGGDSRLSHSRILVAARYTTPPSTPSLEYPGADENASAVGVMLAGMRVLVDMEYQPRRSIVFAAVSQAGLDYMLCNPALSSQSQDEWTVILLEGLGAGESDLARLETGGGLAAMFDKSARLMGVDTTEISLQQSPAATLVRSLSGQGILDEAYDVLVIARPGNAISGTPEDGKDNLDVTLLQEAGEVFTHFMLVLGSQ